MNLKTKLSECFSDMEYVASFEVYIDVATVVDKPLDTVWDIYDGDYDEIDRHYGDYAEFHGNCFEPDEDIIKFKAVFGEDVQKPAYFTFDEDKWVEVLKEFNIESIEMKELEELLEMQEIMDV